MSTRRAMTLLEMTAAITVLAIISVAVLPVIASSADAYASAAQTRRETERIAFAAERCQRLLREAQAGAVAGELDVGVATPDQILFTDGRGLRLDGTDLVLVMPGEPDAPICRGVDTFQIQYLGSDGVTDTSATPNATFRFNVTVASGDVSLSITAFARAQIGG
ncbi:MAG: type II secretion system protein [Phycisphaerales bacterium]